jgi:hypothetical protein
MVATGARILVVLAAVAFLGVTGGTQARRGAPPTRVVVEGRAGEAVVLDYDPAAMAAPSLMAEVYVDVRRRGVDATEAVRLRSRDEALRRLDPGANLVPWPPVSIDPTSGRAGTAVTITMATGPNVQFDAQTTATWQGRFVPLVGDPSPIFQVTYNAAQFREFSAGQRGS